MKTHAPRRAGLVGLILLVLVSHGVWAQQPPRVQLVDEHRPLDWEAVSLSLLVREVETAAQEEGLQDFAVEVAGNTISIIYRDLQFPADSPEITPETGEKIASLSRVLQRFSDRSLLVEGHTAQVADDPDDGMLLSGQRARAVADAMVATGFFERRLISAEGRGEYQPIADNDTPEGRALNRRVEISVFNRLDEGAAAPQSVWWKQYTDWKAPGATVFVVDSSVTSVAAVRSVLIEEQQRSGARVGDLPVILTSEGIAIVYDQAQFTERDLPTPATRREVVGLADALVALDPGAQVRVGGFGAELPVERITERHYQLGLAIAAESEIQPASTLVGDRPQAFRFDGDGFHSGSTGIIHSFELSANASLPVQRYGEFSRLGIGVGAKFDVLVPGFQRNRALAPIRFGLGVEGLYHLPNDTSSVETMWEFGWMLTAGYALPVSRNFIAIPQIGYGGTVHVLTFTQEEDPDTFTAVNGRSHYSQTLGVELDFAWKPETWIVGDRTMVGVFLRPGYRVFFDEDYLGHSITARLGARFYF